MMDHTSSERDLLVLGGIGGKAYQEGGLKNGN
jgi:hypothetical protein